MEKKLGGLEVKDGKIVYTLELQVDSHALDEAQAKVEKLCEALKRASSLADDLTRKEITIRIDDGCETERVVAEFNKRFKAPGQVEIDHGESGRVAETPLSREEREELRELTRLLGLRGEYLQIEIQSGRTEREVLNELRSVPR